MLAVLASHNEDIQRLLDKGYALVEDGAYLVIRDIPYLDAHGALQIGAMVANLKYIDQVRVEQDDHQVYFAGGVPHGLDGRPIPNLAGGPRTMPLNYPGIVVERSFSNKPVGGFPDFFAKIEHYVTVLCGPAMARHPCNPLTFYSDMGFEADSVFKLRDTLTSRAEIGDLAASFKDDVIAVIGLGGTGSYLLDFLVKMPVREIRTFDGDAYHVHNAYRSPGRLDEAELGLAKAEVFQKRYDSFRSGLAHKTTYIDSSSAEEFEGVTFVFVCVDKGSARAEIFALLLELGLPFIDVGMGLNRHHGPLSGMLRTTYYSADDGERVKAMQLAEMVDDPNDIYRRGVQLAELNAINAGLAVVRYKQIRGFYQDDVKPINILMEIGNMKLFTQSIEDAS